MNEKKFITTANHLDTTVKICGGFFQAAGIVLLIFAALVLFLGEKMFDTSSLSLDLGFLKLYLAEDYRVVSAPMKNYTVFGLLSGSLLCFLVSYTTGLLRKILEPMRGGRPFEADIPGHLEKIAWIVLIGGIAVQVLGFLQSILLVCAYPMEELFVASAIEKMEYVFTADFTFVLLFCAIRFLSYIFSYGQNLQQESDETL